MNKIKMLRSCKKYKLVLHRSYVLDNAMHTRYYKPYKNLSYTFIVVCNIFDMSL